MAVVKEKAQKKAHMELLVARTMESEQVSEESATGGVGHTEDLVSKCVGQVRRRKAVDALRLMNSNDTRLQPEKRRKKIPGMQ